MTKTLDQVKTWHEEVMEVITSEEYLGDVVPEGLVLTWTPNGEKVYTTTGD